MTGIEGIGEAVTGGMVARAVEPHHGETGEREKSCLNCGAELSGPYCRECGQKAHVHRTIAAWWHDFLHSVLHLDGKLWRTLPLLAWRPGDLTRRYIDGERARFVSPLALFLFSVFLMFAVFSVTGATMVDADQSGRAQRDIAAELGSLRQQAAGLEAQRRQRAAAGQDVAAVDQRLRAVRSEIDQVEVAQRLVERGPMIDTDARTGWARLDEGIRKANENPALLFYKIQNNAYKFSWALIPISVPFLWLVMLHRGRYRREFKAYDHLIFVTYSIAFMSLLLIAFVVLRSIGIRGDIVSIAFLLIPPVHIYRQLRGAYRLGRFSAAWRTLALLIFASVALTIFLMLLLAIGVLG